MAHELSGNPLVLLAAELVEVVVDHATGAVASYVHRAYASSEDGHTNFTTGAPAERAFIGVYTDDSPASSTDPSVYTWSLIGRRVRRGRCPPCRRPPDVDLGRLIGSNSPAIPAGGRAFTDLGPDHRWCVRVQAAGEDATHRCRRASPFFKRQSSAYAWLDWMNGGPAFVYPLGEA